MKTKNFETSFDIFTAFALSNEEMMTVRGGAAGDGEPIFVPTTPPVKV